MVTLSLRRPTKQGGNPAVRLKTLRAGSTIHSAYLSALSKSIGSWEAGKPGYEFCNMEIAGTNLGFKSSSRSMSKSTCSMCMSCVQRRNTLDKHNTDCRKRTARTFRTFMASNKRERPVWPPQHHGVACLANTARRG